MKKILLFIISLTIFTSCDKINNYADVQEPLVINLTATDQSIAVNCNEFTFNTLARAIEDESNNRNIMISPYSLAACLSMTANGASGATQDSMLKAIGFEGKTMPQVNSYFDKVTTAILKTDPTTNLSIANSIWYRNSIIVKNDFIQASENWFKATIKPLDFDSPASVNTINKWASDNTNGLIPKVIDKIQSLDIMFLLNAVYFKAVWAKDYEFDSKQTTSLQFQKTDKSITNVPMMANEGKYNSLVNNTISIITIPYGNKAFELLAFLPAENTTLTRMAYELSDPIYFNNLISQMVEQNIQLKFPKFKFKFDTRLNDILCDLGMSIAFDSNSADFSNAFSGFDAYISFVKQNNYIELNEKGTQAASVTTTGMFTTSMPISPISIVFNRPFAFIIREKATGIIIFSGIIEDPNKAE